MTPIFTSQQDLVKYIKGLRSTQVATIVAITDVKMNKKDTATKSVANPFQLGVRKVQTIQVTVNDQYENKVNDAREAEGKEGNFEVAPLQWGEHVSNCVIEHKGQLYVQTIVVEKDANPTYINGAGADVAYSDIKPFMPPYNPATRQQLDDEVKVRTWKLGSIYALWMGDKLIYKDTGTVGPQE